MDRLYSTLRVARKNTSIDNRIFDDANGVEKGVQ